MAPAASASTMTTAKLFSAVTLGGNKSPVQLKHRVAMAPLTRVRTGDAGVHMDLEVQYYSQRATDGGLLISEATNISATARGYFGAPGLFHQEPVEGWKPVTKAVHDKGGKIFAQLLHTGRRKDYVSPRALDIFEIPGIIADYKRAAENVIAAGFDGINRRTDKYGGSIENRARLIFEVVEAVLSSLPSSEVGIWLSPFGDTFGCKDLAPRETYGYVVDKLNDYNLAYLHVIERRGMHADHANVPKGGVTHHFRSQYKGVLITAAGFDRAEAMQIVEEGAADLVAFSRDFISNPDLVERLRTDAVLTPYDPKTFYVQPGMALEAGYTDYPFLGEEDKGERSTNFVWES
ncbi:hypothetical protein BBJ29_009163 [Phytophthora kernoviae]|uniref:NADH:flavin oxidoreductase/NADH oxidase N-terminal domain-containing protein n=1 Tax=Phytophthora kernoviae TaxID=325452 RepID=A0A3F2RCI4_9STRA|nr:hypothetical protein BBJ29_009163 [Phytophthora kernoviae]RLN52944.1 hypothetical protein BBP00_00009471 [Phytophthora kernoviae]